MMHINAAKRVADFARRGIPKEKIPDAVWKAATEGTPVEVQGTRTVFEVQFEGRTQKIAVQIDNRGRIYGANPTK